MLTDDHTEMLVEGKAAGGNRGLFSISAEKLKYFVASARPRQWYKNVLLFVGIVFSANLDNASMWATVMLAFVYFCMLAAAEYLINDVVDRERDGAHPTKRHRPIASGQLKASHALVVAASLIALALAGAYVTINLDFFIVSVSYLFLITAYSFVLKHLVIADVLVISTGFVMRAVAGAWAIEVAVSQWLIVCTFLLALFLALEKRWFELAALTDDAENHRPTLSEYSPRILDQLVSITLGALLVSYLLYAASFENDAMLVTVPFAIYGLFRYLYLVREKRVGAEPDVVFKDRALLMSLGAWLLVVLGVFLYDTLF